MCDNDIQWCSTGCSLPPSSTFGITEMLKTCLFKNNFKLFLKTNKQTATKQNKQNKTHTSNYRNIQQMTKPSISLAETPTLRVIFFWRNVQNLPGLRISATALWWTETLQFLSLPGPLSKWPGDGQKSNNSLHQSYSKAFNWLFFFLLLSFELRQKKQLWGRCCADFLRTGTERWKDCI